MIGKISKAPGPGGTPGLLTADNGRSYTFTSAGWIASSVVPAVGMGVEFDLRGSHAVNVRPTGPFRRPLSGSGSAAGLVPRQANPPPGSQLKPRRSANPTKEQVKRTRGSMLAATRPMLSIFMVTPLTFPILLLLPLIGRLEIISTVLLAGFLGGLRAGGFGKALAAAILVSSAHGLVVYLMFLVGLQLMVDLPHAGGYFDAGIGFVGITVASSIGAVLVALPVFLVLLVSAVIGAATAKI